MEKKVLTIALLSLIAGSTIGFLVANRLNRSELESLRTENARLRAPAQPVDDEPTLSDEELRTRIKKADDDPSDIRYQKNLGVALYRYASMKKDVALLKESTRLLKRVLAADRDGFDVNVALGNAYFDIGYFGSDSAGYAESRQYYETALKKKPDDASVRTDYGLTYFLQQPPDYSRAISEFTAALRSDPKNEKALEFSTQAYMKLNDSANAHKTLEQLKAVNASNPSIAGLASAISANAGAAQ
ncbi:MAG: tetratricopeptide repeat protein [Acidobacteriota bacterium]